MRQQRHKDYLGRVLLVVSVVTLFVLIALLSWVVIDVLLLVFLGVLVAVVFRTLAKPIARRTPLSARGALAVVLLLLALIFAGGGWLLVPEVLAQTDQLIEQVENAVVQVQAIAQEQLGLDGLGGLFGGEGQQWLSPNNLLTRVMATFTTALGFLAHVLFVLFIGLFVAFDPHLYRRGILLMIPPEGRDRGKEVLDAIVKGLRAWLLGRIISMITVGVVTGVGLWLLNVPLALALGFIAALFEFIPVVGPALAAIPGVLLAFTIDPMQAVYVALFYLVVQQLEGNVLTPVVQQKVVSLPPVLGLSTVLAFGILFGPLGILTATPITIVIFIMVRMLYVKDLLEPDREEMEV